MVGWYRCHAHKTLNTAIVSAPLAHMHAPLTGHGEWSTRGGARRPSVSQCCRHALFRMQVSPPADLAAVRLVRFGDVFVDEVSGWSHLCDATCDLQTPDDSSEGLVCPVTRRVHSRIFGDDAYTSGPESAAPTLQGEAVPDHDAPSDLGALFLLPLSVEASSLRCQPRTNPTLPPVRFVFV
jgi:hypothetical protein